jgi:phosphoribosylamine--glycine ligase
MNILLIGSGGREHALAWKLAASPLLTKLYARPAIPASPRKPNLWRSTSPTMPPSLLSARTRAIDLVVVGPEGPLVAGIGDDLRAVGIKVFGPFRAKRPPARGLEGLHQGPLRPLRHSDRCLWPFRQCWPPAYVEKHGRADRHQGRWPRRRQGRDVAMTLDEAEGSCRHDASGRFGGAGAEVVVEEFMTGEEASFFACATARRRCPSARRRTTSVSATAMSVPTPAAWAPIRRRLS